MSIEMDAGAGMPRASFTAANAKAEAAAAELVEGRVVLITLTAVLASSLLGVLVYLG